MNRREEEFLVRNALLNQFQSGRINRREFMMRTMAAGLGLAGINAMMGACAAPGAAPAAGGGAAAAVDARAFSPTFYQWILDLHPSIPGISDKFGVKPEVAPVEGFGIERFVAEAKNKESTWDVYIGMTPFVEMTQFIEAGVIEPWDDYIPKDVIDDILPSIRAECTVDGKLYSWPFLLDVIGMGWNSAITDKAGITNVPTTWDEYLANAQKVVDSGASPYGCVFDDRGWRSLAPFTHSLNSNVYTEEGLFNFTSEYAIEGLKLMKQMAALTTPDFTAEGSTDGGVNGTPDEVAFAAQKAAYHTKYFNAPLRMAQQGGFSDKLKLAALPKFANGEGSTVFWTTGICLLKYGQNKDKAAEYLKTLTYDQQLWKDSIVGTETAHPGQLPPYASIYADWDSNKPDWMPEFVGLVRNQLDKAKAINNHLFGLQQFIIGRPIWDKYLTGEVADPMEVMKEVEAAVKAELEKAKA